MHEFSLLQMRKGGSSFVSHPDGARSPSNRVREPGLCRPERIFVQATTSVDVAGGKVACVKKA